MTSLRRFRFHFFLLAVIAVVLFVVGWYSGWLGRMVFQWMIHETGRPGDLSDYRVGVEARPIEGLRVNASGLTYDPQRNSLFLAVNQPPKIIELGLDGIPRRTIDVKGIADLEGVTHVDGNHFFIVDEAHQQLIYAEIGDDQRVIDVTGRPRLGLVFDMVKNRGFEGVSWDNTHDRLFVAKEKHPLRLFELEGLIHFLGQQRLDLQIREWSPPWLSTFFLRDLSSLSSREDTGSLFLLSDESKIVVELDAEKRPAGMLVLRKGWHGLKDDVPQAEGVAVSPDGIIYLISEPNLFYRFDPPARH